MDSQNCRRTETPPLNSRRSIPSSISSAREHLNYAILPGVLEPPLSIRRVVRSITFVLTRFPSTTQNSEYITAALFRRFCQLFQSRLGTRDCGSRQSTNSELLHSLYRLTSVSLRSSASMTRAKIQRFTVDLSYVFPRPIIKTGTSLTFHSTRI